MDPHRETFVHQSWVFGWLLGSLANSGKTSLLNVMITHITTEVFPAAVLLHGPLGAGTVVPPAILQAFANAWLPCQHVSCPQCFPFSQM